MTCVLFTDPKTQNEAKFAKVLGTVPSKGLLYAALIAPCG